MEEKDTLSRMVVKRKFGGSLSHLLLIVVPEVKFGIYLEISLVFDGARLSFLKIGS